MCDDWDCIYGDSQVFMPKSMHLPHKSNSCKQCTNEESNTSTCYSTSVVEDNRSSTNWIKYYRGKELEKIVDAAKQKRLAISTSICILPYKAKAISKLSSWVTCCKPHLNSPYWALQRGNRNSNKATHWRGAEAIARLTSAMGRYPITCKGISPCQPFNMAHGHSHGCCHDHEHDSEDPAVLFTLYQKVVNCFVGISFCMDSMKCIV